MARYINIDNIPDIILDGKVINPKLDLPNNNVTVRDILECTHEEDVVERSEYEKIKLERDISTQQIHDLGNSVSNAIEEIIQAKDSHYPSYTSNGLELALKILKRNIGE